MKVRLNKRILFYTLFAILLLLLLIRYSLQIDISRSLLTIIVIVMAVLGDQRHGTNIEAPADLIRQIVREEMEDADFGGDINITFGGDLAGLASILAPVITREQRRNSRAGGY